MELRRYKDILGLRTADGTLIAFHPENLEIAQIDEEAWTAFAEPATAEALAELDVWNAEISSDVRDVNPGREIRALTINIAQVCNLKCTYCGAGGDGTYGADTPKVDVALVTKQLQFFLKPVRDGETFWIRFFGGEPLLYPKAIRQLASLARLMVAGRDIRLVFQIVTNGTLITPENAELLADLGAHVTVSFDGPAEINDRVRPQKAKNFNSTEATLRGIENLFRVRDRLGILKVNSIFGAHNLDLIRTYDFVKRFEFDAINFAYASGPDDEATSRAYAEELHRLAAHVYRSEGITGLERLLPFAEFILALRHKTRKQNLCGAGKSALQIDTKGRLFPCNWLMNDPGEAVGQGTQVDAEKIKSFTEDLVDAHNCRSCWARHLCGGGCMAENKFLTGDKRGKNPNYCLRTRAAVALSIEYFFKSLTEEANHEAH